MQYLSELLISFMNMIMISHETMQMCQDNLWLSKRDLVNTENFHQKCAETIKVTGYPKCADTRMLLLSTLYNALPPN